MKVPSKLLHAMLITVALGATTTSCQTLKSRGNDGDNPRILPAGQGGIIGKIKDVFRPAPDPCPMCGMG